MTFISNILDVFSPSPIEGHRESGDLVQSVLITAGFAIAALIFVNFVSTAIINKAAETADCIEGSNVYTTSGSAKHCKETVAKHSGKNSFKKDEAYTGRFGGSN